MRVISFIGGERQRRSGLRSLAFVFCLVPFYFCLLCLTARAQYAQPPVGPVPTGNSTEVLKKVGIEQRLNNQIPLDATFRDESGREVKLGEYFRGGRPVDESNPIVQTVAKAVVVIIASTLWAAFHVLFLNIGGPIGDYRDAFASGA